MANIMRFLIIFLTLSFYSCAQAATSPTSLHLDWIDQHVDPCKNFYAYANGNWQKNNPIPSTYPGWNIFYALNGKNQNNIETILKAVANNPSNMPGSIEQKVGDFYFSGMDKKTINAQGVKPLQPEFDRIQKIQTRLALQDAIAHLQMIGVDSVFNFGQMQDFKNSHKVIGIASQGGLGLPDRDYYLKNDKKFQQTRQIYVQHIKKMFVLLGDSNAKAAAAALIIMRIETRLAKVSMSRVALRNPTAIYHPMNRKQLQRVTPHFSWKHYLTAMGHPEIVSLNLATPGFFKAMDAELKNVPLSEWKTYLRWQLIGSFAPFLSDAFVQENFQMVVALSGVKQMLPRGKRVVNEADRALGFAVGQLYVEKYFPPAAKEQVQMMISHIQSELKNNLQHLSWMSAETRKAALKKLALMRYRVGYPDKWRDYSHLQIDRGPYILNIIRANLFLNQRDLNKIGKPVDQDEWGMTPQTVNAYYEPSMNMLNIPAGILQPPFFDLTAPAALNYGAIGFIIGHEITHGFDDQGAQFDGFGNLKNWWSKSDLKKFQQMSQHTAQQFSRYTVGSHVHIQGQLVVGEATADLGGLGLAYRAFHACAEYKLAKVIRGFTPDQQFFLGAGHIWASNVREKEAERLALIDPHPPALYRVNGTLVNMQEFQAAYATT